MYEFILKSEIQLSEVEKFGSLSIFWRQIDLSVDVTAAQISEQSTTDMFICSICKIGYLSSERACFQNVLRHIQVQRLKACSHLTSFSPFY